MDATWQATYARNSTGVLTFVAQVIPATTCTGEEVQIWNYSLGNWETKDVACANTGNAGFSEYDTYNLTSCPSLPSMQLDSFLILGSGGWSTPNFSLGSALYLGDYCFTSGSYTFGTTASNGWTASTP